VDLIIISIILTIVVVLELLPFVIVILVFVMHSLDLRKVVQQLMPYLRYN